ncbi:hypothetical protein V2I52_16850 [Brenneria sp. g21c3]|uniref:hypothetical protein n=1 Tax=Brenneria sp. g21c3 TaxID=3093893 RepID=UPI002E9CE980|nr:hypothetical protein [Brenneria sp. g21c3]
MEINSLSTSIATWQSRLAAAGQSADKLQPTVLEDSSVASATMDAERPSVKDTSVPADPGNFDVYQKVSRPGAGTVVYRPTSEISKDLANAFDALTASYASFQKEFATTNPQLAEKSFGFSVGENGRLVVIDSQGTLDTAQTKLVEQSLNASSALVSAANKVAQLQMEYVEASPVYSYGKFHLDLDNYAQTIDLGRALGVGVKDGQERQNSHWDVQLWQKGEKRYDGWEKLVDGKWVAAPEYQPQNMTTYA